MSTAPWIQTASGRKVNPLKLRVEDINIDDIAHHLSNICRFTGATKRFYSVAQHSFLVSNYCEPQDALWGLLHDASEAYLLDLVRPLKQDPSFKFYRYVEAEAMTVIATAFGLPTTQPASVTIADQRMLATEARDLMSPLHSEWRDLPEPYAPKVQPWMPELAREQFLIRFTRLTLQRKATA